MTLVSDIAVPPHQMDFHLYLPPYRSLLSPEARYDYRTHSLVPITENDFALPIMNTPTKKKSKKMKYKSLLGDVSRRTSLLSLKIGSIPNLPSAVSASNIDNSPSVVAHASLPPPLQLKNVPVEILQYILELVDDFDDYKCCILVSKQFYQLAKPFLYRTLAFTSTYKFAQFVTCIRLNSDVGLYVKELDLSGIKPSNFGIEEEDEEVDQQEFEYNQRIVRMTRHSLDNHGRSNDEVHYDEPPSFILAGWRDWKFKSNPIYSIQSSSTFNLTKTRSNSVTLSKSARSTNYSIRSKASTASSSTSKIKRLSRYFKHKKRLYSESSDESSEANIDTTGISNLSPVTELFSRRLYPNLHPSMNKLLYSYSSSKDVPIGYVIHVLNLCPNLVSINLANLSLSVDYEIHPKMAHKYQIYDLMNNFPKEMCSTIYKVMAAPTFADEFGYCGSPLIRALSDKDSLRSFPFSSASIRSTFQTLTVGTGASRRDLPSSASSVYSFHPPSRPRYNSLLPPLPKSAIDTGYHNKGDGKVFLSDLNLKSINPNYLQRLPEVDLLKTIANVHSNRLDKYNSLKYLNLSSMIWLTKSSVQELLAEFMCDSPCMMSDDESHEESLDTSSNFSNGDALYFTKDLIIDLTDSGMYKNLLWAKNIDLNLIRGIRLATKIVRDELLDVSEYNNRREQARRGRMGENYFS